MPANCYADQTNRWSAIIMTKLDVHGGEVLVSACTIPGVDGQSKHNGAVVFRFGHGSRSMCS